jgi:hypothetical protein
MVLVYPDGPTNQLTNNMSNNTNFSTPLTRGGKPELAEIKDFCTDDYFGCFKVPTAQKHFDICTGAPCEWSLGQGATHTLLLPNCRGVCGDCGMRGVRVAKSRIYVITDEDDAGNAEWSTWTGKWEGGTL